MRVIVYRTKFTEANPQWGFSLWGYPKNATIDIYLGKRVIVLKLRRGN